MPNIATIFVCMVAGILLRVQGQLVGQSSKALNTFVTYVAFPAMIIHHIPATLAHSGFSVKLLIPISMPWIMVLGAYGIFSLLGQIFNWPKKAVGALILTAGFANTSMVGFPILEALMGPESLETAIVISQAGSFLALSTVGIIIASSFSKHEASFINIAKRLTQFPPFWAMVASVLIYVLNIDLPDDVDAILLKLAAALVPVALVAVGNQIQFDLSNIKLQRTPLFVGLSFKLLLAPLVFAFIYMRLLDDYSYATAVTVLEAAMAPMITGAVIAGQFELDEGLAYLLVGIGIPLSLLTVPGWYMIGKDLFEVYSAVVY
jgi:predicted permease